MSAKYLFERMRAVLGSLTQSQVDATNALLDAGYENVVAQMFLAKPEVKPEITPEKLKLIYPGANTAFCQHINFYAEKYGITTKERLAAFLANTLHETSGYTKLRESLDYTATRLLVVFPARITNTAHAQRLVEKGQTAIGDAIYGGRYGNGQNNGDGYRYRGGGLIHTTFKENYKNTGQNIKVDLLNFPEKITEPETAVKAAMYYWQSRQCNAPADRGDITTVRLLVNGGSNGLAEVKKLYVSALKALS